MKRARLLPYSTQSISNNDIKAVANALERPLLTQGEDVERFERAIAKAAGKRFAVVVNSGTGALHAAYAAAGVGKGDAVLVPALTFAATANAALYLGAKPVFVDVDRESGLMSFEDAERKITKKTRAIVPVDYAGRPADLIAFRRIAQKNKLVLISDAAQSLGALYRGKPAGSFADMTIYSFHPVKSITTGEGGAVATDNAKLFQKLRLFRSHGIAKRNFINKSAEPWYQEMQMLGFNYRMPDPMAALGVSQLHRLSKFIGKRRAAAKRYEKLLGNTQGIILPVSDSKNNRSAWHLYTIRVRDPRSRRKVYDSLRNAGIGVQVHHIPVYLHPYYRKLGYKKGLCPEAERWYAEEISLPLYPLLTEKDQRFVAKALFDALS